MLEPPDLAQSFASDRQRADSIVELVTIDRHLQDWVHVRAQMSDELPPGVRGRLLQQPARPGDSPEARLARWVAIFGDDLEIVHDTRSRVVHGVRTPDGEIRGAVWLGRRLLDLLGGPVS